MDSSEQTHTELAAHLLWILEWVVYWLYVGIDLEGATQSHTGHAIYFQIPLTLGEEALNIPPVTAGGRLSSWQLRRVRQTGMSGTSPLASAQPKASPLVELYLHEGKCLLYLTGFSFESSWTWALYGSKATICPLQRSAEQSP